MTVSDEQLLACIDGEVAAEERAALEARIAADPELARRYAAQLELRDRLRDCFDPVLEEPVPRRLLDAASGSAAQTRRFNPVWLAAAASLAAGMILGPFVLRFAGVAPQVVSREGQLTAGGQLAQALSRQLAADQPPSAGLRVGVSFVAKTGQYCRTFVNHRDRGSIAGLACRDGETWRLRLVESVADAPAEGGPYTQAASLLPPSVLQLADALMIGDPLDAAGEVAARANGWRVANQPAPRK